MTQHTDTLSLVRKRRRIARRQRPYAARRSKLDVHRAAIIALHDDGASFGDIQYYLRALAQPPVTVARSTILRFLTANSTSAPE